MAKFPPVDSAMPAITLAAMQVEQLRALAREREQLKDRIAELEARLQVADAPPVVPLGWEVSPYKHDGWQLALPNGSVVGHWHPAHASGEVSVHYSVPLEALSGFLHAIRTGKRPAHASDIPSRESK